MNLTSPSQVKAWCIDHEFHPNKTLGQNFLIDRNILEAIVDAGLEHAKEGGRILEIGPGLGVMTEEILRRGFDVLAIEKDAALAEGLAARVAGGGMHEASRAPSLEVVVADALDVIANDGGRLDGIETLLSNLPYQAGTRILLDLAAKRTMKTMTVLLQSEVAQRLSAKEGGRERSLAGVWVQLDYDVEIVRKVSAACFWPRPEIGSTVVRLRRHDRHADLGETERKAFFSVARQAFAHRRKQLASIFRGYATTEKRAETLSVEEWIDFAKGWLKHENS